MDEKTWDDVLRCSGFSGTDHVFHDLKSGEGHTMSLIVSQAIDDGWGVSDLGPTIPRKVEPESLKADRDRESIVLVGGQSAPVQSFLQSIASSTVNLFAKKESRSLEITSILELEDAASQPDLLSNSTVLVATDMEQPILCSPISQDLYLALQKTINTAPRILWLTQNRLSGGNAAQNMMVGMGRCIANETLGLKLRFLDVDDISKATAADLVIHILMETIALGQISYDQNLRRGLWTVEREMLIRKGQLFVSRLMPIPESNARYVQRRNGLLQPLTPVDWRLDQVDRAETLRRTTEGATSTPVIQHPDLCPISSENRSVRLLFSTNDPLLLDGNTLYLSLGEPTDVIESPERAGLKVIASRDVQSQLSVPDGQCFSYSIAQDSDTRTEPADPWFLHAVACIIAGFRVFDTVSSASRHQQRSHPIKNASLFVHGTGVLFQTVLAFLAEEMEVDVYMTSLPTGLKQQLRRNKWVHTSAIHPRMTTTKLRRVLHHNQVSVCLSLSDGNDKYDNSELTLSLPSGCQLLRSSDLLGRASDTADDKSGQRPLAKEVLFRLEQAVSYAARMTEKGLLSSHSAISSITKTIDWNRTLSAPSTANASQMDTFFDADRTYFLAGLTSDLGLSIARWMAVNGARHIAMASRNPRVPQEWLDEMMHIGAGQMDVRIYTMDVTRNDSVRGTCDAIRVDMPKTAGVIFGALVSSFFFLYASLFTPPEIYYRKHDL